MISKTIVVDTANDDVPDRYRWTAYGLRKKGDVAVGRYYKCTTRGCPVRKYVERRRAGLFVEYRGHHTHRAPLSVARAQTTGQKLLTSGRKKKVVRRRKPVENAWSQYVPPVSPKKRVFGFRNDSLLIPGFVPMSELGYHR